MKKVFILLLLFLFILSSVVVIASTDRIIRSDWEFTTDKDNKGVTQGFLSGDFSSAKWVSIPPNTTWNTVAPDYHGIAWYKRNEVFYENDLKNYKYIYLIFKGIDEEAYVYVNGQLTYEHTVQSTNLHIAFMWNNPFCVDIAPYLKPGYNTILVKVSDPARAGGIYGPIRILMTNTPYDLEFKSAIELNPDFENYIKVALKSSLFDRKYKPFSLFWFSDIHGDDIEMKRLVDFYDYYKEYFNDAICTGDIIESTFESDFNFWSKTPGAEKVMFITGNHDTLKTSWADQLTEKETYDLYFANYISKWNVQFKKNHTYYYKDYEQSKIRLICLDCMLVEEEQTQECDWLKDILKDASAKDLNVIIATHIPFIYDKIIKVDCGFTDIEHPLDPKSQEKYPSYKNINIFQVAVDDFMKEGGSFVCWICGHCHSDEVFYNTEFPNQLQVVIDSANRGQSPIDDDLVRSAGFKCMDLANAFIVDVSTNTIKIIRIGADRDKFLRDRSYFCYDYKNKKIVK